MTLLRRSITKTPIYGYCLKYKRDITESMFRNRNCSKKSNHKEWCKYRVLEIPITEIICTKNDIPILRFNKKKKKKRK